MTYQETKQLARQPALERGALVGLARMLASVWARVLAWGGAGLRRSRQRQKNLEALKHLDERLLRDVGLSCNGGVYTDTLLPGARAKRATIITSR